MIDTPTFPPATRRLAMLAALVLLPVAAARPAAGQSPAPDPNSAGDPSPQSLSLAAPDLASRPDLIEAAKVKPVPPETLERVLPAKVAGLSRTGTDKSVQPIGPVVISVATGRYGAAGAARTAEVTVFDPAGLPKLGEILPLPEPGQEVEFTGRVLRRTEIGGFPAVVADGADGLPSLLQVIPGGRIRVTMQGNGVSAKDLAAAAASMNLASLVR